MSILLFIRHKKLMSKFWDEFKKISSELIQGNDDNITPSYFTICNYIIIFTYFILFLQVQKQVQPTLTVQIEALIYLEDLLLQLLQQLCSFQPHNVGDVEAYIHSKFPPQIREWAINSARSTVEKRKKKTLTLPVDKLQLIMQKV